MIKFSIVPIEAISDPLLTPAEFKVLVALYSFRDSNADTCWPSLASLAERAGYKESTEVSKITGRLVKKGWVEKKKLGFDKPNSYKLGIPDRLRQASESPQVGGIAQDGEDTQAQVGQIAQAQVGQIAQPNKPKNKPKNKPVKDKTPLPDWLDSSTWGEYVKMRKSIKSPMTDYAKKLAVTELEKFRAQGLDPHLILNNSIQNSWKGLFAPKGDTHAARKQSGNDKTYDITDTSW